MEKATRFKKARIIALDAGTFVGTVERLILDLESRTVAGILLEGGTQAIDGEELRSLGEDAVTIQTASTIIELNQATELAECIKGEDEVYKKEVFTVAGKKVGFITDVLIDSGSRSIVGFDMFSEFLFKDDVHGIVLLNEQVIFGRDLVLVPANVEHLVAEAEVNMESLRPKPALSVVNTHTAPQGSPQLSQAFDPSSVATSGTTIDFGQPASSINFEQQPAPQHIEPQVLPSVASASPYQTPNQSNEPDNSGEVSESIDFSGVEMPKPEVIHGPAGDSASDDGIERPDMVQLFQNFPISNENQPSPEPIQSPVHPLATAETASPIAVESGPPVTLFPDDSMIGEPLAAPVEEKSAPMSSSKPSPKDKLIGFVLGKVSSRDVLDVDGNEILRAGDPITEEVVAAAQAAELMPQVFLAASQGLHSRFKRRR